MTAPTIVSLLPLHGIPGIQITIQGTGFATGIGIAFDGVPGTGLIIDSPTQVRVTVPSHTPGSAVVTIIDTAAPDTPVITAPATSLSTVISGISLSAHDTVGVAAYFIKDVAHLAAAPAAPAAGDAGWVAVTSANSFSTSTASYTVGGTGARDLYAWFKDAAGNVSAASALSTTTVNEAVQVTRYWSGYTLARNAPLCSTPFAGRPKGGFSFRTVEALTITQVQVQTQTYTNNAASNLMRMRICADNGSGLPDEGTVLATVNNIAGMPATANTNWTIVAVLGTPLSLAANTVYHALYDIPSPTGNSHIYLMLYNPDPLSDGFASYWFDTVWHVNDNYYPGMQIFGFCQDPAGTVLDKYWAPPNRFDGPALTAFATTPIKGGFRFLLASDTDLKEVRVHCRTANDITKHTTSNLIRARLVSDATGLADESGLLAIAYGIAGMPSAINADFTVTVTFALPVHLLANTPYHVIFDLPGATGKTLVYMAAVDNDPLGNGFYPEYWNGSAWQSFGDAWCPSFVVKV